MVTLLSKLFGTNWTTNLPATGFALCTSAELIGLIPEAYEKYAAAFCSFALAVGLFAAKSANVSNAPAPVASAVVPPVAAATPNPSAVQ
jgi:hypothetical protein